MLPLPPVPLHLGWRNRVRLGRDYYVRLDTNDYSVDPHAIGRLVDVTADLDRVRVRAGRTHRRRPPPGLGARHSDHRPRPRRDAAAGCDASSSSPGLPPAGDDLARDLADYDRAFGLTERGAELMAAAKTTESGQADHLSRRRAQSTPDHRSRRPAGRPGPRRGLVLRGLPRRRPRTRSLRPQRVRRGAAHPSGRVPRPQDPRGLRLGRPTSARAQIAALASGGFLTEARNVVLLGPPGTGKTHLATALGIAAARHGHRVLFATATDWVTRLTDAHRAGTGSRKSSPGCAVTG